MADWKPGMLAVCVDAAPSEEGYMPPELVEGEVYTVFAVGVDPYGSVGLFLDELDSRGYGGGYLAWRFRPVIESHHELGILEALSPQGNQS